MLRCFLVGNRGCQVRVRISASESCSTTSARCLCQDFCISSLQGHWCKISVCGSLVQDLSFRISAPRSCSRATCARSLYEDLLCKISVSGCLYQEPLGPLAQDHCMRISCKMSASESPQQNPVGALAQDRCMRISCARCLRQDLLGSCRSTCARSVCAELLSKISLSGSLHQDPVIPLAQDLCLRISCARCLRSPQQPAEALVQDRCMRISCAKCLCQDLLSRTTCARSLYADLLCISLCQDLCIRILYDHLCKISLCGSLAQDLCQDLCIRVL